MRRLSICVLLTYSLYPVAIAMGQSVNDTGNPRSLKARAANARAAGNDHADLGTFEGVPPDLTSINEALASFDIALVTPLTKETVVENGRNLITWYKVRIDRKLSISPRTGPSLAPSLNEFLSVPLPKDLPSGPDELLLLQHGGTAVVDGVTFTEHAADFPPLLISKQYLCMLSESSDGNVGIIPLGGAGVFKVTAGDSLQALGKRPHPLLDEIKNSYGNSLGQLSRHLRNR
jgi:hypothetical protein